MPLSTPPAPTTKIHHDTYSSLSTDRPELSVSGRTILITGSGSGIGQETAVTFAKAGARAVILCGRRVSGLETTKARINDEVKDHQLKIVLLSLDITNEDAVTDVFKTAQHNVGPIDVVINCAGHLSEPDTIRETTLSNFWTSFEVNVKGAFLVSRAFLKHCVKDDGRDRVLILLSSALAHLPASTVRTAPASYGVAKIAEAKLAEYVAKENPGLVRAYATQPGTVETEMSQRSVNSTPDPAETRKLISWDTPQLAAGFNLWLASPLSRKIPSGRFLWINWDVDELEGQSKRLEEQPHMLTMGLGGWPFTTA